MSWTVKRIEAGNFMGFRKLDLDLSKYRGITSVEGLRKSPGTSNGASKSSLFEIIHWVLRGKLLRKNKTADKVRYRWADPKEKTFGRLTIEVDTVEGRRELVVERSRTKSGSASLTAHLAGESQSPSIIQGMQGFIDHVLGLEDDRTLSTTTIFTGSTAQFCQLKDADRKEALERMIGVDHFAAASKLADQRLVELNNEMSRMALMASEASRRYDMLIDEKRRAISGILERSWMMREKEEELFAQVEIDHARMVTAFDKLTEHHLGAEEARQVARRERYRLEQARDAAIDRIEVLRAQVGELDKKMAVVNANISQERKNRNDMKAGTHPDKCPTCGQRWPHEEDPAHLEKALADMNAKIIELQQEIAPLESERQTHLQEISEQERARRRAVAMIEDIQGAVSDQQERALLSSACGAEAVMIASMDALAKHRASMPDPEHGELNTECPEIDEELAKARDERINLENKAKDAAVMVQRLTFWKKGFGRRGMPSYLLDSSIPGMNEVVARVASMLSNGELSISFDSQAAKGAGEVFAVNVEYADGADDYDMASHGEHTRVDLSVLFALRDLVERRGSNRCTQLFLDELFDGTDAAFGESCMAMLRALYSDRDIFLISHDDAIKAQCDNSITVVKKGREAVVQG